MAKEKTNKKVDVTKFIQRKLKVLNQNNTVKNERNAVRVVENNKGAK